MKTVGHHQLFESIVATHECGCHNIELLHSGLMISKMKDDFCENVGPMQILQKIFDLGVEIPIMKVVLFKA